MKILVIGNSFSTDATHYLHQIAEADGQDLYVVNLYIGGCSLERHWNNIVNETAEYLLEINGASTGKYVSVQEALAMENYDVIVTQQASPDSGLPETYHPYLDNMDAWLKERQPGAKYCLQETWAYEIDSIHPCFPNYHQNQKEMYEKVSAAYKAAAAQFGYTLIPSGDVIQQVRTREPFLYGHGGMSLCRDGFHMNLIYGRYLLAATWYRTLTGATVSGNTYVPKTPLAPGAICDEKVLSVIKAAVDELV